MINLLNWVNVTWLVVYILGVAVAVIGYKQRPRLPFVLLLVYFALGIYAHTLSPYVNRWICMSKNQDFVLADESRHKAMHEELTAIYEKYSDVKPVPVVVNLDLPIKEALLVIALWFLVRNRERRNTQQSPAGDRLKAPPEE